MLRAVDMRAEYASVWCELSDRAEREHLESAAVGEYGSVPRLKFVQTACRLDDVKTRAQVKMLGVAEVDFSFDIILQGFMIYALD